MLRLKPQTVNFLATLLPAPSIPGWTLSTRLSVLYPDLTFTISKEILQGLLHRWVCPARVRCLSSPCMEEFQASESPLSLLLPSSLHPYMGSWVERYVQHPASVWQSHWLRIPRACVQADSMGTTLTLVIHLDQLQPLVPKPACEEWELAQEQGGGKTGFLSFWGPFLFPLKHMANMVWGPCSCLLALLAGCADDLPKASVIHSALVHQVPGYNQTVRRTWKRTHQPHAP